MARVTTSLNAAQVTAEADLCRRRIVRLLTLLPLGHPSRPPLLAALAEARAIVAEEGHA